MKPFKVYAHPQGGYEAVESGWSWNACGLGPFWALSKKMWAIGVGVLAVLAGVWGIAAASLGTEHGTVIINVGSVLSCVAFGAYGSHWHQAHLEARGFVCQDTVTAADGQDAVERYRQKCADPARRQAMEIGAPVV